MGRAAGCEGCWLLEEDESAPGYFWKGAVRLEPKKKSGSVIYSVFFLFFFPFSWMYLC